MNESDQGRVTYLRQNAEEMRAIGGTMGLKTSREAFEKMAASYDHLADRLEASLKAQRRP